jgi:hypothetical protein
VVSIGQEVFASWPYVGIDVAGFAIASRTRLHPIALLVAGGVAAWLIDGA